MNSSTRSYFSIPHKFRLTILGAGLFSVCHMLTAKHWYGLFHESPLPLQDCTFSSLFCSSIFSSTLLPPLLMAYGFIALPLTLTFFFRKSLRLSYKILSLLFFFKCIVSFIYPELNTPTHTLLLFVEASFLFLPQKTLAIQALTLIHFLMLGFHKLHPIWFSGHWLKEFLPTISQKGLEWIAFFIILTHLATPVGLLFPLGQVFFTSFVILALYCMVEFIFIDSFTAFIHGTLLCFYLFALIDRKKAERETIYRSYLQHSTSRLWILIPVSAFLIVQMISMLRTQPIPLFATAAPQPPKECSRSAILKFNHETVIEHYASTAIKNCDLDMIRKKAQSLCLHSKQPQWVQSQAFLEDLFVSQPYKVIRTRVQCEHTFTNEVSE